MGRQRLVLCALLVVVSLWSGICDAGKKVDIRIVPRPLSEEEKLIDVGPIPFRPPETATGPYSYYVDNIGCIKDLSVKVDEQPFLLDVCHLKNVTFIEDIASRDTSNTENDSSPSRKILGMFRGWHIDPITKMYKIAIFDDGDLCAENPDMRYAVHIELVPSAVHDIVPHAFDFKKISECTYAIKVEFYVSDFELHPTSGIHTTGVLDLSDPEEAIEHICGVRKCKYTMVQEKIEGVENKVQQMKEMLSTVGSTSVSNLTVNTASLILRSSTDVMEKSLELLHSIEALYDNIQVQKKESREIGVGTESDPPNAMDSIIAVTEGTESATTES